MKLRWNFQDLTGQKFGHLTVVDLLPERTKQKTARWLCLCSCGEYKEVSASCLKQGKTISCGSKKKHKDLGTTALNLVGKRFTYLKVIKKTDKRKFTSVLWECLCDCGKTVYATSARLNGGLHKSCGCSTKKLISEANKKRFSLMHGSEYSGENSPAWKGGITSDNTKIRNSREYNEWRISVLHNHDYTCAFCNLRNGKKVQAHHVISFHVIRDTDFLYDIDNGIVLCEECHKAFHKKYGRMNNNAEQMMAFLVA